MQEDRDWIRSAVAEVKAWIGDLQPEKRETFLNAAENTWSPIELWLYARALGFDRPFEIMHAFASKSYPKMSRRRMLQDEATKIELDLSKLREDWAADAIKPDQAVARISQLTKELRSHIKAVDDMTRTLDRRGLILAGADKVLRELALTFKNDVRVREPLEEAEAAIWASIQEEAS